MQKKADKSEELELIDLEWLLDHALKTVYNRSNMPFLCFYIFEKYIIRLIAIF